MTHCKHSLGRGPIYRAAPGTERSSYKIDYSRLLREARNARICLIALVGAGRFELPTPCAQGRCATRLRYPPTGYARNTGTLACFSRLRGPHNGAVFPYASRTGGVGFHLPRLKSRKSTAMLLVATERSDNGEITLQVTAS